MEVVNLFLTGGQDEVHAVDGCFTGFLHLTVGDTALLHGAVVGQHFQSCGQVVVHKLPDLGRLGRRFRYGAENLLFVDGWIGKGAILGELKKELSQFPDVSSNIAVLADPANVTDLCGTHDDILIPSSCLNSTVSGLVSRTFLRDDIIGKDDFHGAVYYGELADSDLSYEFIDAIEKEFELDSDIPDKVIQGQGIDEVRAIAEHFSIDDINLVKPGIGETTRVLLRRIPWKVLIDEKYKGANELAHIVRLAEEKNVPIEYYPLTHYKTCGIIKKLADA